MKKKFYFFLSLVFIGCATLVLPVSAAGDSANVRLIAAIDADQADVAPDGSWVIDPEVTRIGKNASRSGLLLDWTLRDYQWASSSAQQVSNSPLAAFWLVIQRIVYALFLVVILIAAFVLIITRGRSLSAKRFLPRFFLAVLLVTFSFSLIQFIYQFIDIIQGFFLKNPDGQIISSKDLLFIGFNYEDFQGLRRIGLPYEESAFISLILVKITAFTYYVMALLLIFRKILLWFFIVLSPVFPILLLFYPIRNTGKIWIGEFFRWVCYAPLFAIFLSGVVQLWHRGLPLIFNFSGVESGQTVYPTAINILLGGPGQKIGIANSVNLPDTFALYLVALIMLWAVIILPFILLQVFLDHMLSFNYQEAPVVKQMMAMLNTRLIPPPKPAGPITPIGPTQGAGLARQLPFSRRFAIPTDTGLAREIPRSASVPQSVQRPTRVSTSNLSEIKNLTSISVPTLRDIARFESTRLSQATTLKQESSRVQQVLRQIANPNTSTSSRDRERFQMIREKLLTESQKGNQVARTLLNAALTYNSSTTESNYASNHVKNVIQSLQNPQQVTSRVEREKIVEIREKLNQAVQSGNVLAQVVMNTLNTYSKKQLTQLQSLLQNINHPETVKTPERVTYQKIREQIVAASKSGNPLATLLISKLEKASSQEEAMQIQEALQKASVQGNSFATELLQIADQKTDLSNEETDTLKTKLVEAQKKGEPLATLLLQMLSTQEKTQNQVQSPATMQEKLKAKHFPAVNRVQQVSLDDYESVKKMWKENYQHIEVPGEQTRKEWITQDVSDIEQTINLLTSSNPQEVEQGMQKVSDILPFLLIGGFSQTEIVAYLKAKMEAGKTVLEEVNAKGEEEDTLLQAERAAKAVTNGKMTMTAEASIPEPEEPSVPIQQSLTSDTITNSPVQNSTSIKDSAHVTQSSYGASQLEDKKNNLRLLTITQLPLLKLSDIVRYELHTKDVRAQQERQKIESLLRRLTGTEQKDAGSGLSNNRLREELQKEEKSGNELARMILSASEILSTSIALDNPDDSRYVVSTILALGDASPSLGNASPMFQQAATEYKAALQRQDPLAMKLKSFMEEMQKVQVDTAQEFMGKISNPSRLATASEQMHYSKLAERIAQASEDGDTAAAMVLRTAREPLTHQSLSQLITTLQTSGERNSTLSNYILTSITSLPQATYISAAALYQELTRAQQQSTLAKLLIKVILKERRRGSSSAATPLFPKQNRLQTVTLNDYETVKKMWIENYLRADPPLGSDGKPLTREEWIKQDAASLKETISLLSSGDNVRVEEGMENVGSLLPFLLIGGFSQDEIIGYLQAKLEAGKYALNTLENSMQEEVSVKGKSQENQLKTQSVVLEEEKAVAMTDEKQSGE